MNNKRNKYLFKNTFIFAISNFATKIITFFLLPLYTYKLTTAEYGIVDLLYTIGSFLYPLFTLNISESIFRFSMDKNADHNKIINIGLLCSLLSILCSLLIFPVFSYFSDFKQYAFIYYIYLVSLSFSQILLISLKGQEKLKEFTIGNILYTISTSVFSIVLLIKYNLGIYGYFSAYIISNILLIIYVLFFNKMIKTKLKIFIEKKLFLEMVKYSIVLLPTSFMWWITNSSDRIMVAKYISEAANGIYAVSYKIPSLLTVLMSIFNQAWVFTAIKDKDNDDIEKYTNLIFDKLASFIIIIAIILLIFIKPILYILVSPDFYDSWKYTPFLIFGFVFMTLATFISSTYNAHKDNRGFLFSGIIGAVINIVLNFILIPIIGIYGAAIATMVSYIIVFYYRLFDTKKYIRIYIEKDILLSIFILLIICISKYLNIYYEIIIGVIGIVLMFVFNKNNIILFVKFPFDLVKKFKK